MPKTLPLTEPQKLIQSATGAQDELVILVAPTADPGAVGQRLRGRTLATNGDYICLVPLHGIFTELQVHLTATFAAGTVTSAGPDSLYYVADFTALSSATVKTSGTGDGALTTATRQSSSLTGLKGEQYARVTITIAGGASAAFTQAEYNGY